MIHNPDDSILCANRTAMELICCVICIPKPPLGPTVRGVPEEATALSVAARAEILERWAGQWDIVANTSTTYAKVYFDKDNGDVTLSGGMDNVIQKVGDGRRITVAVAKTPFVWKDLAFFQDVNNKNLVFVGLFGAFAAAVPEKQDGRCEIIQMHNAVGSTIILQRTSSS